MARPIKESKKEDQAEKESLAETAVITCAKTNSVSFKKQQLELVKGLLVKVADHLANEAKIKATLGDYIKLVQLQQSLEEEEPRDIKVGWVDRLDEETSGE